MAVKIKYDPILGEIRENDHNPDNYKGVKQPDSAAIPDPENSWWIVCGTNGTYTNYGGLSCNAQDRLYYNAATAAWEKQVGNTGIYTLGQNIEGAGYKGTGFGAATDPNDLVIKSQLDLNSNVFNVTEQIPLDSGYYTFETAKAAVPVTSRHGGMFMSFESAANVYQTYQFSTSILGLWDNTTFWAKLIGNKDVSQVVVDLTDPLPDFKGQAGFDAKGNKYIAIASQSASGIVWSRINIPVFNLIQNSQGESILLTGTVNETSAITFKNPNLGGSLVAAEKVDIPDRLFVGAVKSVDYIGEQTRIYSPVVLIADLSITDDDILSAGMWIYCADWSSYTGVVTNTIYHGGTGTLSLANYYEIGKWRFYYKNNFSLPSNFTKLGIYTTLDNRSGSSVSTMYVSGWAVIQGTNITPSIFNNPYENVSKLADEIVTTNATIVENAKIETISRAINYVPNADFYGFESGLTANYINSIGVYQTTASKSQILELVENKNVPLQLFPRALKIGMQTGQRVLMYSARKDIATIAETFSTLSIGVWCYSTNWAATGTSFKMYLQDDLGSSTTATSLYDFGNGWKFMFINNKTLHTGAAWMRLYFDLDNRSGASDLILYFSNSAIIAGNQIEPFSYTNFERILIDATNAYKGVKIAKTLAKLMAPEESTYGRLQRVHNDHVRIVGLGDSVMAQDWINGQLINGVSGTSDGRNFEGLRDMFPNANYSCICSGVGGHTASDFKKMMFGSVVPYDPDLVIIFDWNNSDLEDWTTPTDNFYSSYEEILIALRKYTTADIMVCSWSLYPRTYEIVAQSPGTRILKQLAAKYGAEYVDIAKYMWEWGKSQVIPFNTDETDYTEWYTRGLYATEGDVHPNLGAEDVLVKAIIQHFKNVNNYLKDDLEWNLAKDWFRKEYFIEAEAGIEIYDDRVKYSDYDAFTISSVNDTSSELIIESVNATEDNEYVEFEVIGSQVDLMYVQKADGAEVGVLIDGVLPSTLCKNSQWYPDADDNNANSEIAERVRKPKFINGTWHTSERIVITAEGTTGATPTGFKYEGDVSGLLLQHSGFPSNVKLVNGDDTLYIRADFWSGRTSILAGDKFYLFMYNAQAIPLDNMGDWVDNTTPLIEVADSLDENFLLRFKMTDATNFRLSKVSKHDYFGEGLTDNEIELIGTGVLTSAFSSGAFSISLAELTRIAPSVWGSSSKYYYVNRKYTDLIDCYSATEKTKKVTLAWGLKNTAHTVRLTKSGTGKMYIDGVIVKKPEL